MGDWAYSQYAWTSRDPVAPLPLAPSGGGCRAVDPADAGVGAGPAPILKGRGRARAIAHRFEKDARAVIDDGRGVIGQVDQEIWLGS